MDMGWCVCLLNLFSDVMYLHSANNSYYSDVILMVYILAVLDTPPWASEASCQDQFVYIVVGLGAN